MNWTPDKIAHYRKSFNWSRTGLVLGIWMIFIFLVAGKLDWWMFLFPLTGAVLILLLGAAKEIIYDGWMKQGCREWADMKANFIGAWDGLIFKKERH